MSEKTITLISTDKAPGAIGPYSQAVQAGGFVFISGQISLEPRTGSVVEGGIREQTDQVMKNIGGILNSQGLGYNDIVKTEIYLKDMNDFSVVNEVYGSYFQDTHKPARVTLEVSRLPRDVLVEISCTAYARQESRNTSR